MRLNLFLTLVALLTLGACGDTSSPTSDDSDASGDVNGAPPSDGTSDAIGAPESDGEITDGGDEEITESSWSCVATTETPDYLQQIGCRDDFEAVASLPLDASIPGARSTKSVVDRFDDNALYIQNANIYALHYEFCTEYLSGDGLPPVGAMAQFNQTEYYSPDRRFLLGILTWYEEPGVWVYEIEPWDTMTAELIEEGFEIIRANTYFGDDLYFHPASEAIAVEAEKLPDSVPIITTDELFAGVTYQPLNLGTSTGKLRFLDSNGLANSDLNYRDIVVLDHVPNDIGVVSGIITGKHQTPLSHINVLSQNRGTPNMALIGAFEDETLAPLDGSWVELTVGAFDWSIREVTKEEADAWWEANKPEAIDVPPFDLSITEIKDVDRLLPFDGARSVENIPTAEDLESALAQAIPAFGGKASHYAGFSYMGALDQSQTDGEMSMTESAPWQTVQVGLKGYLERLAVQVSFPDGPVESLPVGVLRVYEGAGVDGALLREQSMRMIVEDDGWTWVRLIDDLKVSKDDVLTLQLDVTDAEGVVSGAPGDLYTEGASSDGDDVDMAFKTVITKVRHPKAFGIPIYWYREHMTTNGLDAMVDEMLADPEFQGSASVRADRLDELQDAIKDAPMNPALLEAVTDKMIHDFGNIRMRFRSSTNAEDLGGFTGAGLYTSKTGDLNDPDKPPEEAIKKVWASIWNYKAYDERQYRSIDHKAVGMALLCHRSFPDEEANGVALTANIFDTTGLEPGFYINVQYGGASVVLPEAGTTTDQIVYYYYQPGQPQIFLSHSNLIPEGGGDTVLTNSQLYELGTGLDALHQFWKPLYGPPPGELSYYAMDVEFKFEGLPGEEPELFIKQARPHPGWGL